MARDTRAIMSTDDVEGLHYHTCGHCHGEIICWDPCVMGDYAAPCTVGLCPLCAPPPPAPPSAPPSRPYASQEPPEEVGMHKQIIATQSLDGFVRITLPKGVVLKMRQVHYYEAIEAGRAEARAKEQARREAHAQAVAQAARLAWIDEEAPS